MTDEETVNIAVVERYHALLSTRKAAEATALCSDPFSNHGREVPRHFAAAFLADMITTFPDLECPIEAIVAAGPVVVARCRYRGTHRGVGKLPINGGLMIDVPPTSRHMDVQHIHWYVLRDGLIAEHWANRDDVDMMRQLGLLPPIDFDHAKLAVPPPS